MSREAILVIADILAAEMALPPGQIMLEYERYRIPDTSGLYIALAYLSGKPIGSVNYSTPDSFAGMIEHQEVTMLYDIQIDAMSFDASARTRKEEIYQAMASVYAQQAMAQNLIQVSRLPQAFANTASLEETKILNRFTAVTRVSALLTKTKPVDYYNTFPTPEVHVNA